MFQSAAYRAQLVAYEQHLHSRQAQLLEADYEAAALDQRRATASIEFALANLREELDGFRQHEHWIAERAGRDLEIAWSRAREQDRRIAKQVAALNRAAMNAMNGPAPA